MTEGDVGARPEVPAPPSEHGGLGAADFPNPGVPAALRRSIHLLPAGKRRLLFVAAAFQISLGLLDLIGVALLGLVAAVAVSGIGPGALPAWLTTALARIGLAGLTISQLTVVIALGAVLILVLKTGLSALMSRRIIRFLAERQAEVSVRLAREFLSRPLVDVQRWTTPEAIYALGPGVGAATVSLLGSAITIASECFLFIVLGISLLIYDPLVTVVSIVIFGCVVLVLHRLLGAWSARNAQISTEAAVDTLTVVSEALSTYRESTVLNRRDLYVSKYERLVGRSARANATTTFILEIPKYVLEAALYLSVMVLAVVLFLTRDWTAAASTTALFLAAGTRIIPALLRLQGAGITVRNAAVQAQPTFYMADFLEGTRRGEAAEEPWTSTARVTARDIHQHIGSGYPDFVGDVVLDGVTFRYPDAPSPALIDASLQASAGSSLALVGSTGAGKSTLADVILGVLHPDAGSVRISGHAPREAIARWPGAISYVPQAVALVVGTVKENVAFGVPVEEIDDDLAWEALRRAHLADFLLTNREGLATPIGERGFKLSGGQRQRLGIARALYTRPKLLVLDEATSSLDAETELAIIQTLDELEGDVTTVTIAHRLATVRRADVLLYLEAGRIVAAGSFDEVRGRVDNFDRQAALLGL